MARKSFYSVDNYGPVQRSSTSLGSGSGGQSDSMPKMPDRQKQLAEMKDVRDRKLAYAAVVRKAARAKEMKRSKEMP